ncbi:MAG TPA: single-stranded-DNA-specific exonuclease RecJ [Vicinamibacterales bacterium]|nr:single-stranded-DNA-specific exonuclease RecJ [Vicinamibacterales bacterium]
MIPRIWQTNTCDDDRAAVLARELGVTEVTARLLAIRGLYDLDEARRFLSPSLEQLLDPFRLADMERAVVRLEQAVANRERIAIHGDYDVDGITSTVILRRSLELLGGDVVHFVPERIRDGYGLQPATFDRLKAEGVQLVVSVDCGIRAAAAARRARELGIDLIITDHHEPDTELPEAVAVVNPKRHDCTYPDKHLAGVGVALKLVQALCRRAGRDAWVPGFVKVAAIGTLADVVPLVGENRVIAKLGLEMLSKGPHKVGLRALLEASSLTGKTIDSYHIAFMIAPRINAAGRMSTPDIAARLLLASDEAMAGEAKALAEQLETENLRRRAEEQDIVAKARKIVETDPDIGARSLLVVAGEGWHRGVIGIVASKLVDHFYRPAIVLSVEDGIAHGSCRSIPGFDMLAALESCAPMLGRFGGHKQAAGLQIEADRIREFRLRVNAYADDRLGPDDLRPRLYLDGPLAFGAITDRVVSELNTLAPFGPSNPRPRFFTGPVEVVDGPRLLKDRHLKMTFQQDGRRLRGIQWNAADREEALAATKSGVELAYTLEENEFRGEKYVELRVDDFRDSG